MSQSAPTEPEEAVDLAALGKTWTPEPTHASTPEVTEMLQEMPWWAARGLLFTIAGLVIALGLWSHFSAIDVLVEARGVLVPEGYLRPVQAHAGGVVRLVLVREGETVRAGDPLIQLDDTAARAHAERLRQELELSRERLLQYRAAHASLPEILESEHRIAQLEGELAAAELALRHTCITAPTDGIVASLLVRNPEAVVQPGERVAAIVPEGVPLVAEAQVQNKDVALLEPGLPAKLKLDAFPFQDYGVVPGVVAAVAHDAQTDAALGTSFYKVMITPQATTVRAHGKRVPLRPGMAFSVEIATERRTLLSLFTEPLRKLKGDLAGVK